MAVTIFELRRVDSLWNQHAEATFKARFSCSLWEKKDQIIFFFFFLTLYNNVY